MPVAVQDHVPAPLPALCRYELEPCAGGVIDLNADAGEGYDDAGCLQYVTSVTVAPPRTFLEPAWNLPFLIRQVRARVVRRRFALVRGGRRAWLLRQRGAVVEPRPAQAASSPLLSITLLLSSLPLLSTLYFSLYPPPLSFLLLALPCSSLLSTPLLPSSSFSLYPPPLFFSLYPTRERSRG